ncbi:hypothetical protein PVAP13_5KG202007 [Panicum virgatum]|uniref:Uncharacterized protein n=1 Tax=Panicum virgatum TaxID=38727 RepID=A0A8T0SBX4_PANVG|nr:hypothetical protein PVAP13_5KG202007 [Panicum virgatum]
MAVARGAMAVDGQICTAATLQGPAAAGSARVWRCSELRGRSSAARQVELAGHVRRPRGHDGRLQPPHAPRRRCSPVLWPPSFQICGLLPYPGSQASSSPGSTRPRPARFRSRCFSAPAWSPGACLLQKKNLQRRKRACLIPSMHLNPSAKERVCCPVGDLNKRNKTRNKAYEISSLPTAALIGGPSPNATESFAQELVEMSVSDLKFKVHHPSLYGDACHKKFLNSVFSHPVF